MIRSLLKQLKPLHWLYNLMHYRQLQHNARWFRQYGIRKPLFASLSSKDFPDKTSRAWLDTGHSRELLPGHPLFSSLPANWQDSLLGWSDNGFAILPGCVPDSLADAVNAEVDRLLRSGQEKLTHDNKLLHGHLKSEAIRNLFQHEKLQVIASMLLGQPAVPFQTLNFVYGSGQRAHSDSIHMTTYPLGYLMAAWIALEDIDPNSGPLFYYPGSHKLPYLLNEDFNAGSSRWRLGARDYDVYEDRMAALVQESGIEPQVFLPKKGDVLLWHANLVHGGMPVQDAGKTRKSMVIHYFGAQVIKYHEITERPALMPA